tara:strand:+ start:266 stop:436 length:171 start_codon:yes stop_codon:yes gene_type:complete
LPHQVIALAVFYTKKSLFVIALQKVPRIKAIKQHTKLLKTGVTLASHRFLVMKMIF